MDAGMKFCPACGTAVPEESEPETEPESEGAQEPEMEAGNDGAEEAETGAEDEGEEPETEPEGAGLTEEQVKEIVRQALAEMADANKAQVAGELSKAIVPVSNLYETLQKSQKSIIKVQEQMRTDFAHDLAVVVVGNNALEAQVNAMQKTVESYGPVVRVAPRGGQESGNNLPVASGITEKDMLKVLIANPKLSPMVKQSYQARLTELEIMDAKPLEEPPTFL
jgi:hypothetical protein